MLSKNPMSGVEIVEVIGKETGGRWIPSPGSVYPLLSWLRKREFTNEIPTDETGIKRYELTNKGLTFFEKQVNFGRKMLDKMEFLVPLLIGKFELNGNDKRILAGTKEPAQKIVKTLLDLRAEKNKMTEEDSKAIEATLEKCACKLDELFQNIRKRNPAQLDN
jgi:DNA-binding PadR family transcriptional regulator